jgi:hypothetical protein
MMVPGRSMECPFCKGELVFAKAGAGVGLCCLGCGLVKPLIEEYERLRNEVGSVRGLLGASALPTAAWAERVAENPGE